jgi:hypothetical protein
MAISLKDVKRSTQLPPRIVLYGVPGIGKTTIAAGADRPIFIPAEDGFGTLDVPSFPKPDTFTDITDCLTSLMEEDHDFGTLVIDSADKVEPLIHEYVCEFVKHEKGHAVERIEQYGYGKGYTHALNEWRMITRGLDILRERKNMAVVIIAHSTIAKAEAPDADVYDRYQLALHKSADAWLCDWADAVLFANFEMSLISKEGSDRKRAIGKGKRALYTQERPAFRAKNRYSMPEKIELSWAAIAEFAIKSKPAAK